MKIKKGDKVKVMRGQDRGKVGAVLQVLPVKQAVIVEKVNTRFRHLRARKAGEQGQRVEFPAPLNISNVMLVCPKCDKVTRVAHKTDEAGKKSRACKKCQSAI